MRTLSRTEAPVLIPLFSLPVLVPWFPIYPLVAVPLSEGAVPGMEMTLTPTQKVKGGEVRAILAWQVHGTFNMGPDNTADFSSSFTCPTHFFFSTVLPPQGVFYVR